MQSLPSGFSLGPFRLVRQLGRGGFAPVWLAEEIHDGLRLRDVAIKLFFLPDGIDPTSPEAARRRELILDEARALCRIEHPAVVRLLGVTRDDPHAVIGLVMEHVPGRSLDLVLRERGRLTLVEVLDAGITVAWALSAVHQAGLVHRDVKPANIIAGPAGYKLIDFGIHAPVSADATDERPLTGTPGFIAPECLERGAPPTPAADLFALGVTLRCLLGAEEPRSAAAPPLAAPDELRALMVHLLASHPMDRPQHADRVARELSRIRRQLDLGAASPAEVSSAAPAAPHGAVLLDDATRRLLDRRPSLIGRGDALSILDSAAAAARGGSARFVLISGPLGAGRTRLLDEVIARAGAAPARVLRARCSPERRSPLRPLVRAIEALPDADARRLRPVQDAIDRALSPAAQRAPRDADLSVEGVEDALLWVSEREPLLLAIDDVQWGDALTLLLLRLLVERADHGGAGRLLVVAAVRYEPHPAAPLRALRAAVAACIPDRVHHIRLGALGPADTAALAAAVAPISPELEEAVVRGSGGIPFFVVHALAAWLETGAVAWRGGRLDVVDERVRRAEVPGVAELIEARVEALFPPRSARARARAARRALAAVALHGGDIPAGTLQRVVGEGAVAEQTLDALIACGLLVSSSAGRELGFAQEMVRQAVLNLVRHRPWYARVHRALLDELSARGGLDLDPRFLALGYERLGDVAEARRWTARAFDEALAAGLFDDAAELGERLAALAADPPARVAAELDAVRALLRGRGFDVARTRLERLAQATTDLAAAHPRLDLRRRVYRLEIARGLRDAGAWDDALLADADASGDAALRCEARMALAGVASGARALELATQAIAIAERDAPHLELVARVLRAELGYTAAQRDLPQCQRDLRRALELSAPSASPWHRLHIEGDLAVIEADLGDVAAAVERLRRLAGEAEALRMLGQHRLLLQSLAAFLLRQDHAAEAAEVAARVAALAASAGDTALRATALSVRAAALHRAGFHREALASADEAAELQRAGGHPVLALTLFRRAEILLDLDRPTEALETIAAARRVAQEHGGVDLSIRAALWEELQRARRGLAAPGALARVLVEADAAPMTLRRPTLSLVDEARAYLGSSSACSPSA